MTHDEDLRKALGLLFEATPTGTTVILFGSRARGRSRGNSDYDFLVVEPQVSDRFAEMSRLSALLGSAMIPADVIVQSRESFERWCDEPNSLAARARKEGRLYESAA